MTIENAFASTRETCHAALLHFGGDAQLKKANEELGELLTAMARFPKRASLDDIAEEIADVLIVARQLAILVGEDRVEAALPRKLEKLRTAMGDKGGMAERISRATKVRADDYEHEVVFVAGDVLPVGEAEVQLASPCDDVPAWGVTVRRFKLDAEKIVEAELEHHHDNAWDELEPGAVGALQKALDTWIAEYASRVTTYERDDSTIVVFGEEREAANG